MRLLAVSLLLAVLSILCVPTTSRADTVCDCLSPPGGRCHCEDDQIAICKVEEGECVTSCRDVSSENPAAAVAGAIAFATNSDFTTDDLVGPGESVLTPAQQLVLDSLAPRTGDAPQTIFGPAAEIGVTIAMTAETRDRIAQVLVGLP